ncbi:MAG: hypothetical protein WD314_06285 [Trueperaceae bacterium]
MGFDVWNLIAIAGIALLVGGLLSPLETLGWWAGWFGRGGSELALAEQTRPEGADEQRHFLVFLTGVHSVSGQTFARREQNLLRELRTRLPDSAVVEVFPYSVTNRALTGQRVFGWFWRWALSMKLSRRTLAGIAGMVINLRNLWQVAVSADRRYGPLYNQGSAELIVGALVASGYRIGSGMPVTLIGYSGGGQVAVGAAGHLSEMLACSIRVISIGGVMSSDPGLHGVHRLYHLAGRGDMVQRLSLLFFPGRWRLVTYSAWNQALAAGRIRHVDLGPMNHTGAGGYLDSASFLDDSRSYLQATVDEIARIVDEAEVEAAQETAAASTMLTPDSSQHPANLAQGRP